MTRTEDDAGYTYTFDVFDFLLTVPELAATATNTERKQVSNSISDKPFLLPTDDDDGDDVRKSISSSSPVSDSGGRSTLGGRAEADGISKGQRMKPFSTIRI